LKLPAQNIQILGKYSSTQLAKWVTGEIIDLPRTDGALNETT